MERRIKKILPTTCADRFYSYFHSYSHAYLLLEMTLKIKNK